MHAGKDGLVKQLLMLLDAELVALDAAMETSKSPGADKILHNIKSICQVIDHLDETYRLSDAGCGDHSVHRRTFEDLHEATSKHLDQHPDRNSHSRL